MSDVIRISDEQMNWLDKKKQEYFNTDEVSYRAVMKKIKEDMQWFIISRQSNLKHFPISNQNSEIYLRTKFYLSIM